MKSLMTHDVIISSVETRTEPIPKLRHRLNLVHLLSLREKVLLRGDCRLAIRRFLRL